MSLRHPDSIQLPHQGRQSRNGIIISKVIVGMTAPGADPYPETLGTNRPVHDAGKRAVKGTKALYPVTEVLTDFVQSLQVSQPFFPCIAHQQKSGGILPADFPPLGGIHMLGYIFPRQQKTYQTCCVVPHAGTIDTVSYTHLTLPTTERV